MMSLQTLLYPYNYTAYPCSVRCNKTYGDGSSIPCLSLTEKTLLRKVFKRSYLNMFKGVLFKSVLSSLL